MESGWSSRASRARDKRARVTLLGEAEATDRARTCSDLRRLEHIRELLRAQGWDAAGCALAVYVRSEPSAELVAEAEAGRVQLVGLHDLYGAVRP